jgi:hypothetical protein
MNWGLDNLLQSTKHYVLTKTGYIEETKDEEVTKIYE